MKRFVVDASVAVKWCLPPQGEELFSEAEAFLESYRRREVTLLVPDLFWVELANALWKVARNKKISIAQAQAALGFVGDLGISTIPTSELVRDALDLAARYDRTVYDSLYVALALETESEMVTADEKLANALAARLPVKWLGGI